MTGATVAPEPEFASGRDVIRKRVMPRVVSDMDSKTAEVRARDGSLWSDWEKHLRKLNLGPDYVSDGVADPERFYDEARRVLFAMKEPNKWKNVDVRSQLAQGAKHRLWHNVARWAAGTLGGFRPYDEVEDQATKDDALRRIALINVKKLPGDSASNSWVIGSHAFRDRALLRRQIEKIAPSVIIACGDSVFLAMCWLLELDLDDNKGFGQLASSGEEVRVIRWKHPAARMKPRELYQGLAKRCGSLL